MDQSGIHVYVVIGGVFLMLMLSFTLGLSISSRVFKHRFGIGAILLGALICSALFFVQANMIEESTSSAGVLALSVVLWSLFAVRFFLGALFKRQQRTMPETAPVGRWRVWKMALTATSISLGLFLALSALGMSALSTVLQS